MSKTEEKVEKKELKQGLSIFTFKGEIKEDKATNTPAVKYRYQRIVMPWSKAGKAIGPKNDKGEETEIIVEGSVPTFSQVLQHLNAEKFTTEFSVKDGESTGNSVVGLLIEGYNSYLNRLARSQAENTEESVKEKAIKMFVDKLGYTRDQAIAALKGMK